MGWSSTGNKWILPAALAAVLCVSGRVVANEFSFEARVDKTRLDVAEPLTLTLALTGDVSRLKIQPPTFPDSFQVAERSQSSSLNIVNGAIRREVHLQFVLLPSARGTFQLGPFEAVYEGKKITTNALEIRVERPPLPPAPALRNSTRYSL